MTPATGQPEPLEWQRWQRPALIAGATGLAVCALGGLFDGKACLRAYLVGYLFWLGVGLGCLVLLMLQHLTGGAWGLVLRRTLECGTRLLPFLALLFLPVAAGVGVIYEWAHSTDPALEEKQKYYLNVPFFLVRAVIYFAAWIGFALLLNRWSADQDREADPRLPRRFRLVSAPGLGIYGLTITFASIDWLMSLDPHWFSSIFAVMVAVGQVLSGLAFGVVAVMLLASRPPLSEAAGPTVRNDLGNLLMAFVMLWAYMSFSQFLLIYSGNLQEEVGWYIQRKEGGWQFVALALALFQFVVPFVLLLSRDLKRDPRRLAGVALLILFMRFVDLFWLVAPTGVDLNTESPHVPFLELVLSLAAWVGVGGLWLAAFLWQLPKRPLLPVHETTLAEGTQHA